MHEVEQMPEKSAHEPKLFVGETVLGNELPRPRLPKSLRQLYGNSMDAESQDCSYCKEGWFGIHTGGDKSRLPGDIESQVFQKTNFCQALEAEWLEPGKPICENCLIEAKKRAKHAEGTFSVHGSKFCRSRRDIARNGCLDFLRRRALITDPTYGEDFYLV